MKQIASHTLQAHVEKFVLDFKQASGTSRGVLTQKKGWLLHLVDEHGNTGIGECSIIQGLSPDFIDDVSYERKLAEVCSNLSHYLENLNELIAFPSILFGLECAILDYQNGGKRCYFDTGKKPFSMPINGLIWMGDIAFMQKQVQEKIESGFTCIKLKIGALNFEDEVSLIQQIRAMHTPEKLVIRVDANGAFSPSEALQKLAILNELSIHSIEQPIRAGQVAIMAELCASNTLPIALDEELIGIHTFEEKQQLLDTINPQYIILKPSLHGGISGCKEWIQLANERKIGWWMTSALESNIGLTAIAQFTATFSPTIPQGLGTGALYVQNFDSSLHVEAGYIHYTPEEH